MANRIIAIELTGNNTKAVKAIEGVGAAAAKAGTTAETRLAGASSRIGGAFTKLDTQLAGFGIPFAGALGALGGKLDAAGGKASNFGGVLAKTGQIAGVAGVAGLAAVGAESLKLADSFDQSHARVAVAVKNVGESMSAEGDRIKSTDEKLINLGFSSTQTESALTPLIGATKDVGAATGLMGLAADIARGRHIDLATATNILVKVETGHVSLLGRLGIATKDASGHVISQAEALKKLTALYGGQASAYLDTYAGKQAVLGAKADEVGVKLGEVEKKALEHVADATLAGVQGFEKLNAATDGWLGKAAAIGTGGLIAFGAIAKIVDVTKSAATSLGLLSTAEERSATTTAASQTTAATSTVTSAQAQVVAAARVQISEDALAAAEAKSAEARAAFNSVTAEGANAAAADVIGANRAIEASDARTAAAAERAAAARSAAATESGATSAIGGAGIAGTASAIAAAAGPIALVTAGIVAIGVALQNSFGGDKRETVKALAPDLLKVGDAAQTAREKLATIVGPAAASDVQHYADALLAGASATQLATIRHQAYNENLKGDDTLYITNRTNVRAATQALDDLAKSQGLAGVQSAVLASAQRSLGDDLIAGSRGDSAATARLADDKQAVIAASRNQATTQKTVNAVTQSGIDLAEKAANASTNQADAAKAAAKAQAAAAKALAKDLDAFGAVAGRDMEKVAAALGIPGAELKNLTTQVKAVDSAFGSSFDSATNDISKFKDKAKVSFAEFAADELKSIQATTNWSGNLVLLARQGLSLGFIQELAKAGVSSAGLVQSIEDNVNHGSIATTNSLYKTGQAAKQQAESAFGAAAIAAQSEADKINGLHPTVHVALVGVDAAINQLATFRGNLQSLNATSSIIHFTYSGPSAPGGGGGITHRAAGGPVAANKQIMVGEKGPELFVAPGKSEATVVGARGPELWTPPASGDIVSNDQVKSFTARGTGAHSTIKGYADGTAPFGSYGTFSANPITVTFASGSGGAGGLSGLLGAVPSTGDAVATFEQRIADAIRVAAVRAKQADAAAKAFVASNAKLDKAYKASVDAQHKFNVDLFGAGAVYSDQTAVFNLQNQLSIDRKFHLPTDHDQRSLTAAQQKLSADNASKSRLPSDLIAVGKAEQAHRDANAAYVLARGAKANTLNVERQAQAAQKAAADPSQFTLAVLQDQATTRQFEAELKTLLSAGDSHLARVLATAGPTAAGNLALAFSGNLAKAAAAERSLVSFDAQTKDYADFVAANFKASGGPVDANRAYVVGEKGPEVFIPKSAGTIVPNNGQPFASHSSSRSGQGGVINITIHSTIDAISGRAVYRIVKEDQRLHGAWDIKVNAP